MAPCKRFRSKEKLNFSLNVKHYLSMRNAKSIITELVVANFILEDIKISHEMLQ